MSGVIILLPTLVKTFFAIRKRKGPSRFWLDSHNLVGSPAYLFT
ncbi:PepSY domain-containing protein (plasmid) [Pseudoalteromonas espejiana]